MADSPAFELAAVVPCDGEVTSLDFHRDGKRLIASTTKGSIYLIDSMSGKLLKKVFCTSAGTQIVRFTHHHSSVLVASTRAPFEILHLSLHDNQILQKFKGHTARITSLSMNPMDDHFLSASEDNTVCLWKLGESSYPVAKIELNSRFSSPFVAYSSSALVFSVLARDTTLQLNTIRLYSASDWQEGPFTDIVPSFDLLHAAAVNAGMSGVAADSFARQPWTSFEMVRDDTQLLVNTAGEMCWLLDAFNPSTPPILIRRNNDSQSALGACMYGDTELVLIGCDPNEQSESILVWNRSDKRKICTLSGHPEPVTCLAANPVMESFASACRNVGLWLRKEK